MEDVKEKEWIGFKEYLRKYLIRNNIPRTEWEYSLFKANNQELINLYINLTKKYPIESSLKILYEHYEKQIEENSNGKVYINLDKKKIPKIHPILDFTNESIYLGIYLDYKIEGEDKKIYSFLTNNGVYRVDEIKNYIDLKRRIPPEIGIINDMSVDCVYNVLNIYNNKVNKANNIIYNLQETYTNYTTTLKGSYNDKTTLKGSYNDKDVLNLPLRSIEKYMEMDDEEILLSSLWVIGTYIFPLFSSYPYLFVNGLKNTGKSKLLAIIKNLSFNGIHVGSISSSAVFRIIDLYRPTLCIDEAEELASKDKAGELRYLLLNGYRKGTIAIRNLQQTIKSGDFKPVEFELYCPKVISNIYGLDDIMESRCISITLKRAMSNKGNLMPDNDHEFQVVKDNLQLFIIQNWRDIKEIYNNLINQTYLDNRDFEIWKPIFAIAKFFGQEYYEKIVRYAYYKTEQKIIDDISEKGEYVLIKILKDILENESKLDDYFALSSIVRKMKEDFEDMDWINNHRVGRMMKRIGFVDKKRMGKGMFYRLTNKQVNDIYSRLNIGGFAYSEGEIFRENIISQPSLAFMKQQEKLGIFLEDSHSKQCKQCDLMTDFLTEQRLCEICVATQI